MFYEYFKISNVPIHWRMTTLDAKKRSLGRSGEHLTSLIIYVTFVKQSKADFFFLVNMFLLICPPYKITG